MSEHIFSKFVYVNSYLQPKTFTWKQDCAIFLNCTCLDDDLDPLAIFFRNCTLALKKLKGKLLHFLALVFWKVLNVKILTFWQQKIWNILPEIMGRRRCYFVSFFPLLNAEENRNNINYTNFWDLTLR